MFALDCLQQRIQSDKKKEKYILCMGRTRSLVSKISIIPRFLLVTAPHGICKYGQIYEKCLMHQRKFSTILFYRFSYFPLSEVDPTVKLCTIKRLLFSVFCGPQLDRYDVIHYLLEQSGRCKLQLGLQEVLVDFKPGDRL